MNSTNLSRDKSSLVHLSKVTERVNSLDISTDHNLKVFQTLNENLNNQTMAVAANTANRARNGGYKPSNRLSINFSFESGIGESSKKLINRRLQ